MAISESKSISLLNTPSLFSTQFVSDPEHQLVSELSLHLIISAPQLVSAHAKHHHPLVDEVTDVIRQHEFDALRQ